MPVINKKNPEKLKFFLYSVIVLTLLTIAAIFISYRFMTGTGAIISSTGNKATLSLDKVQHTATKEGLKQWSLKASTVNYYQHKNEAVFNELTVTLFSKDQDDTRLTALKGTLDTVKNDITATGDVVVVNGNYTLESESLHYNNEAHIITSSVPVMLHKGTSHIAADTMKMDINSNVTILEGNVKGTFSEDTKLPENK